MEEALLLMRRLRQKKIEVDAFKCGKCLIDLLVDTKEYYNVCPSCGTCYPYRDHSGPHSPPYKRKWHFMTVLRRNNLAIPSNELDAIFSVFLKLDRSFTTKFPGKNVMNMNFLLKVIADHLGLDHIADKVKLTNIRPKTLQGWLDRFNLVMHA